MMLLKKMAAGFYSRGLDMPVGYARVSTLDQNLDLQLSALEKAGCEKLYQDQISGTKAGLAAAKAKGRVGGRLIIDTWIYSFVLA